MTAPQAGSPRIWRSYRPPGSPGRPAAGGPAWSAPGWCGIRLTSNQGSGPSAPPKPDTVRLTPSTVTEPLSTTYRASPGGSAMRTTSLCWPSGGRDEDHPGAVNMPLHQVTAEAAVQLDRPFQVDRGAGRQRAETRPVQGFRHHVGGERLVCAVGHREADAVDRDRVAVPGFGRHPRAADGKPGRVGQPLDSDDLAELFHYPGEHPRCPLLGAVLAPAPGDARTRERGWQHGPPPPRTCCLPSGL